MKKLATLTAILSALAFSTAYFVESTSARSVALNSGQIRFCENQTERWVSTHAPRDHKFFHQEIVLGEGSYSISMIPNGNFNFNAFVYAGEGNSYVGGRKNVRNYVHNFRVNDWAGQKFLIQLVKTTDTCRGCSVTMVLKARNCPPKRPSTRQPSAPSCPANQCLTSGGIFGLDPVRCVPKPGARGGPCGSPGN